jgi:2-polyprenyl-6-methoxyphenol hydroxylase-like FAD-dependent oxidoreductase
MTNGCGHRRDDLRFETEVDLEDLGGYDLVVAADGANSRLRDRLGTGSARVINPATRSSWPHTGTETH